MGDRLVVDFAKMETASQQIQRALNTLDSHLGELERDAAALMRSWSGEAQEAYYANHAKWTVAADDLKAMLRSIKLALDESAADYLATENRNAEMFGNH